MSNVELLAMAFFVILPVGYYFGKKDSLNVVGLKPRNSSGLLSIFVFTLLAVFGIFITHNYISPFPEWIIDDNPIRQIFFISAFPQELFFRGTFLPILRNKLGDNYSLLITSLVFSLMHIFVPGVHGIGAVIMLSLTFLGGLYRGHHMLKYNNLYLVIISHAIILLTFNFVG